MNIFKRIWRALFSSKEKPQQVVEKKELVFPATEDLINDPPKIKPVEKIKVHFVAPTTKKWQMRNNRLHIQYNGLGSTPAYHKPLDYIESFRCTNIQRANEIVTRINSYVIERAFFTDKSGKQFVIRGSYPW